MCRVIMPRTNKKKQGLGKPCAPMGSVQYFHIVPSRPINFFFFYGPAGKKKKKIDDLVKLWCQVRPCLYYMVLFSVVLLFNSIVVQQPWPYSLSYQLSAQQSRLTL